MKQDRRIFLKQAGVAGAAAVVAGGCSVTGPTHAVSAQRRAEGGPMPRKMTFATLMNGGAPSLGV